MKRHYLFPLGFHEDYIMRRLLGSKPGPDDKITVITCSPAETGNKTAYKNLEAWLANINLAHILDEILEVECNDIPGTISRIKDLVDRTPAETIITDISGGMRILGVSIVLATLLSGKNTTICIQTEQGQDLGCIPRETIELIRTGLTQEEKRLLETLLENPGLSAKQYAQILGKTEKTIQNRLAKLAKHGLITRKGRGPRIYPTKWAKLFIKTRETPGKNREKQQPLTTINQE